MKKICFIICMLFMVFNNSAYGNVTQYENVAKRIGKWTDIDKNNYLIEKGLSQNQIDELGDKTLVIVNTEVNNYTYNEIIEIYDLDNDTDFIIEKYPKGKIVPFDVNINNVIIDNEYSEYPFILYKDITYFPLTYNMNSFMGVCSDFDGEQLDIHKCDSITEDYKPYQTQIKNDLNEEYAIFIPNYSIYINGMLINNMKEEYPFINYKGITYFPMTWKNTFERFGFSYEFTPSEGLKVNNFY